MKTQFTIILAFIAFTFCAVSTSFSQTSAGSIVAGGTISYTQSTNNTTYNQTNISYTSYNTPYPDGKTATISTGLSGGYFMKDNLAIGITFNYTNTTTLEEAEGNNNEYYTWNYVSKSILPGIFAEKFIPISDKFYITLQLNASYTNGDITNSYLFNNYTTFPNTPQVVAFPNEPTTGFNINFAPGLSYFPASHWDLTFKLTNIFSYSVTTVDNFPSAYDFVNNPSAIITYSRTTNAFGFGAGLTPTLGVNYFFGK